MSSGVHARHISLLEGAGGFAQHKLDTTTALLTRLGIQTPSTPNPAKIIEAAMSGSLHQFVRTGPLRSRNRTRCGDLQNTLTFESNVRDAVSDLPLVKPMAQVTKISSFLDYRKDPLRLSLAFHGGIDF